MGNLSLNINVYVAYKVCGCMLLSNYYYFSQKNQFNLVKYTKKSRRGSISNINLTMCFGYLIVRIHSLLIAIIQS